MEMASFYSSKSMDCNSEGGAGDNSMQIKSDHLTLNRPDLPIPLLAHKYKTAETSNFASPFFQRKIRNQINHKRTKLKDYFAFVSDNFG